MIKEATWWGNKYILSGSDCGHIFGWDRDSGQLVFMQEADRSVTVILGVYSQSLVIFGSWLVSSSPASVILLVGTEIPVDLLAGSRQVSLGHYWG